MLIHLRQILHLLRVIILASRAKFPCHIVSVL